MIAWISQRLQEASSWAGFGTVVLGALHVSNAGNLSNAIVGVLVAIGGLLAVVIKEGAPAA